MSEEARAFLRSLGDMVAEQEEDTLVALLDAFTKQQARAWGPQAVQEVPVLESQAGIEAIRAIFEARWKARLEADERRADAAEALVERYRAALSKARATMDFAANLVRGREDDPSAVRAALAKLDYARHETELLALLADPAVQGVAP